MYLESSQCTVVPSEFMGKFKDGLFKFVLGYPRSFCNEWNFPEPPNTFAGGPGNSNGGGGGGTGGDLDFDELARRFDQLKKK
ncbi:hypothetical protein ANCDUO_20594 [Ancylostoma duodenale]|uniref:Uncharacterized protein n=1 Tax=Ancylostoma duodenale TaxID=51022 RepID=A0A0C2FWQ5_9BILA|nr:hypothetical protein ANCDUO_20594 [Ancylostoma duodenale]